MKMEPRTRAPEGGWGWMVVLGSCISHLLMVRVPRSRQMCSPLYVVPLLFRVIHVMLLLASLYLGTNLS